MGEKEVLKAEQDVALRASMVLSVKYNNPQFKPIWNPEGGSYPHGAE